MLLQISVKRFLLAQKKPLDHVFLVERLNRSLGFSWMGRSANYAISSFNLRAAAIAFSLGLGGLRSTSTNTRLAFSFGVGFVLTNRIQGGSCLVAIQIKSEAEVPLKLAAVSIISFFSSRVTRASKRSPAWPLQTP